ncbi:DedA family protein [Methylobacterium sp. WL69]|nr:DedA family protein [Methylobacterium sp. WL69]
MTAMASQDLVALFLGLGLPGLFGIAFAEKFVPVVPSYVMLMLLGMTVPDATALLLALLATAAGSLCASLVWYGIGRGLGERRVATAVVRFGKYVFFSPRAYAGLAAAYRRNHFWVTLIGQTVPVARIYLALPAGVLGLRPAPFARAAAIGIAVWNAPFLALGYALRETGHTPVDVGFWVSLALVATEVAVVVGIRLLTRGRRTGPSPDDGPSAGPCARAGGPARTGRTRARRRNRGTWGPSKAGRSA